MVVKKILKQLTLERIKKEIKSVQETEIPSGLKKWVKEYEKTGERDVFTWKIFLKAKKEINYYISTPKRYRDSLEEIYFLIAIFTVLLDDIADRKQDNKLLKELFKIPFAENILDFNKLNQKENEYLKFTLKVWHRINLLIKKYPGYKNLKEIFIYDIKQIINAMEYDYLINKNHFLINKIEFWLYAPHTMQFITMPVVDLMCLSVFNINELSAFREINWQALKMLRIGNWISTWEKEIKENDFTSGVFSEAINLGILKVEGLRKDNEKELIHKIKKAKIERRLLREWENGYKNISTFNGKIKVIDIKKFLICLEKLLFFELISKKYK